MQRLTNDEQKKVSLQILREIDRVCKKHGLTYFIAYGTLLGAVRHKGFIPWDDDIDIWVPIGEYRAFLDAVREDADYAVLDHLTDPDWLKCFSKVSDPATIMKNGSGEDMALKPYGVAVDIFPLFPAVKEEAWWEKIGIYKRNLAMIAKSRAGKYRGLKNLPKRAFVGMFRLFGHKEMYWKKRLWESENEITSSEYLGCVISPYKGKDIHEAPAFSERVPMAFEDGIFQAPAGWDRVLGDLYGDYMTLPPIEKRVSNHEEIAYWL